MWKIFNLVLISLILLALLTFLKIGGWLWLSILGGLDHCLYNLLYCCHTCAKEGGGEDITKNKQKVTHPRDGGIPEEGMERSG